MTIQEKIKLQLPDHYLEEEVREGYTVTEKQKKIWAIELDLLSQLLNVCKKHDIKICAFAGTILGAVRHKGFIPWDDDIDVALTREEYNKLLKVASNEFHGQYFFQTDLSDPKFFVGFSRLRNSLTTGIIVGQDVEGYNNGIYLDIFPVDGIIEDEKRLKKFLRKRHFYDRILQCYQMGYRCRSIFAKIYKLFIHYTFCKIVPYSVMVNKYNDLLSAENTKTDNVGLMTHPYSFIKKYWCDRKDIHDVIYVPFENIEIPIPRRYDEVLTHLYGKYMQFPPVEQRGAWHEDQIMFEPDVPYTEYIKTRK